MKTIHKALLIGSLAAVGWGPAHAYTYQPYTAVDLADEGIPITNPVNATAANAAFEQALGASGLLKGTEAFETQTPGVPPGGSLALDLGDAGKATLSGAGGTVVQVPEGFASPQGRYSVPGGSRFYEVLAGQTFTVTFDREISAFSFWGTDIGDFDGTLSVQLFDDTGTQIGKDIAVTLGAAAASNGSVLHFGIIAGSDAELFKSIRFVTSGTATPDAFGFDSFSIYSKAVTPPPVDVPEPASLALAGLALAGLAASRRRR